MAVPSGQQRRRTRTRAAFLGTLLRRDNFGGGDALRRLRGGGDDEDEEDGFRDIITHSHGDVSYECAGENDASVAPEKAVGKDSKPAPKGENRAPYSLSGITRDNSEDEKATIVEDSKEFSSVQCHIGEAEPDTVRDGFNADEAEAEDAAVESASRPSDESCKESLDVAPDTPLPVRGEGSSASGDGDLESVSEDLEYDSRNIGVHKSRPRQALLADGVRRILALVGRDDAPSLADEEYHSYDEALELRAAIVERCEGYLDDFFPDSSEDEDSSAVVWPLPHPKKVLHHVAPRIPAIRQSRDITLRIMSARADVDAGAAARAIGAVAALAEMHDRIALARSKGVGREDEDQALPVSGDIVSDRRFEQLVECVLCGLDLKRSTKSEASMLESKDLEENATSISEGDGENSELDASDEEEIERGCIDIPDGYDTSDPEDFGGSGGSSEAKRMTITDISIAAWGMSVLGVHELKKIGGRKSRDILVGLCMASADLLTWRLDALRRGDALSSAADTMDDPTGRSQSARLSQEMTCLASDAALALWAFACVRACTGLSSPCWDHHVDICCAILSADEKELLEARESMLPEDDVVVERLARAEVEEEPAEAKGEYINIDDVLNEKQDLLLQQDEENPPPNGNATTNMVSGDAETEDSKFIDDVEAPHNNVSVSEEAQKGRTLLIDKIAPCEVANILWALALPGLGRDVRGSSSVSLAPILSSSPHKKEVIRSLADRTSELLRLDIEAHWRLKGAAKELTRSNEDSKDDEIRDETSEDDSLAEIGANLSDQTESFGMDDSSNSTKAVQIAGTAKKRRVHTSDRICETIEDADRTVGKSKGDRHATKDSEACSNELGDGEVEGNASWKAETLKDEAETLEASKVIAAAGTSVCSFESNVSEAHELDREVETLQEGQELLEVIDASKILEASDSSQCNAGFEPEEPKEESEEGHPGTEKGCSDSALLSTDDKPFDSDAIADVETNLASPADPAKSEDGLSREVEFVPSFALRGLSSMAWALTELRHSSRSKILALVAVVASLLGKEAMMELGGGSLSNLAWVFAKDLELAGNEAADSLDMPPSLPSLIQWIGESALSHMNTDDMLPGDEAASNLQGQAGFGGFEPPELSRLMWSLSMITSSGKSFSDGACQDDQQLCDLACAVLHLAGSYISDFTAEDLARIVWAYTELCPADTFGRNAEFLGRLTSTIEASLLRWENGQCSAEASKGDEATRESVNGTPLFGKSRLSLPFLDLLVSHDEEDGDETTSIKYYRQQQASLPNLRDLTVDPSTLCKIAYGLSKLAKSSQEAQHFSGTCLRIATRLFASKQGRLLRECNSQDLVRLCCACSYSMGATGKFSGADQEFIFRHFPRRVCQLLNENEGFLMQLPAENLADLLWSLGELGVQESREAKNPQTEYKMLRLVAKPPTLSGRQLEDLSPSCTTNLLCGLVQMGYNSSDVMINVLKDYRVKVSLLQPGELCRSLLCLVKILRSTKVSDASESSEVQTRKEQNNHGGKEACPSASSPAEEPSIGEDATGADIIPRNEETDDAAGSAKSIKYVDTDKDEDEVVSNFEEKEAEAEVVIESLSDDEANARRMNEARNHCKDLMHMVAAEAATKISQFSSSEIRQMLEVLVLMPYQSDDLIDAVELEVKTRLSMLNAADTTDDTISIETQVRDATDSTVEAAAVLSTMVSEKTGNSLLKKGFKALIERTAGEQHGTDSDGASESLAAVAQHVNSAAASLCEAAARIERVDKGTMLCLEDVLCSIEGSTVSELAQCQEWIAGYKRLDFATNTRRSRLDVTRRKNMGKRILSRLFQ